MAWIKDTIGYLQHLATKPMAEMTRRQRMLRHAYTFARVGYQKLQKDNATQMAAALTYRTLFGLLPMLVVALVGLQSFRGLEGYSDQFKAMILETLLPDTLLEAPVTSESDPDDPDTSFTTAAPPRSTTGDPQADPSPTWLATSAPVLAEGDRSQASPTVERGETDAGGVDATTDADPALGPQGSDAPDADDVKRRVEVGEEMRGNIEGVLDELFDQLAAINFGGVGIIGALVLIYAAGGLLKTIESSFNAIFGAERGRPWHQQLVYNSFIILVGPLVLVAGQVAQQNFLATLDGGSAWLNWLAGPAAYLSPLFTAWVVIMAIYLYVPVVRVSINAAAIGSFIAAVGWVIGKELFSLYVSRTASYSIYGALGLIPLFLLWMYLTWLIVLFGLEITSLVQSFGGAADFDPAHPPDARAWVCDPAWILPIMTEISLAYEAGQPIAEHEVAHRLCLPLRPVHHLVGHLLDEKLLHRIVGTEERGNALAPAASPARIPVARLVEQIRSISLADRPQLTGNDAWTLLQELTVTSEKSLDGKTVGDLIAARLEGVNRPKPADGADDKPRPEPQSKA